MMTDTCKRWMTAGLLALLTLGSWPVWAQTPLKFGVLAFRSKDSTEAQWKQLTQQMELGRVLGRPVEIQAYDFDALGAAIARNEIDIVLTNPGDYSLLRHRNGVSAPLATLVVQEGTHALAAFGGVMFTRVDSGIQSLADMVDKRIAVVQTGSFGGYQMQAYEMLEAGLPLPKNDQLVLVGMPQDGVVRAVQEGRADVGFVRTGVLESLSAENKLDLQSLRILNRQSLSSFPFAASTRLYPEWPVAVMPQVSEDTARRLAVALLSLPQQGAGARPAGVHGFTVPADYTGVEDVQRRLRIPPFDVVPQFTLEDFARKYAPWLAAVAGLILVLAGLGVMVALQKKRIAMAKERLDLATKGTGLGIWDFDEKAGRQYASVQMYQMLGYSPTDGPQSMEDWLAIVHPEDLPTLRKTVQEADANGSSEYVLNLRMRGQDGGWHWIESRTRVLRDAAGKVLRRIGTHLDITDHKRDQERLERAAGVFTFAREGILITDVQGNILEVNEAFTRITGYSREEVIGENPRILKSGRQPDEFYVEMWRVLAQVGHWSGEVWNRRRDGDVYAQLLTISAVRDVAGQVRNYVSLFTDITQIKEQQQALERIAQYDRLTNLPNRGLLADRLQQAMLQSQRRHQSLAVVFLDLDGFKTINDTYGHDVGDALLVALARRMKVALREGDTLARLGGDEFVAVLVDLETVQDCEPVIDRLLQAAAEPVRITVGASDVLLRVSASMGITLYPQDGSDADQLLRHADQAMYQAKQAGKNRYQLFDVAQNAAVQTHHQSMGEIRRALAHNEFVLYYQPKVNLRTGAVLGAEALIRWQHPELGLLLPGAFLPGVENDAVGLELGEWVIRTALAQLSAWKDAGLQLPVSVNVGAYQLQHPGFVDRLSHMLDQHPEVDHHHLEIEVLESSAMRDIARVAATLQECQAMGVRFALDDFGTGYSSLTYLRRLQAETIKIDRSFVIDMLDDADDLAIVNGIIGLARAFGREVIAEGVESQAHGERLMALGCDQAQGYGVARPMPAHALPAWIAFWQDQPPWVSFEEISP